MPFSILILRSYRANPIFYQILSRVLKQDNTMDTPFATSHTSFKVTAPTVVLTLSAMAALTGLAALRARRAYRRLRETHLDFDFPIEEQLFIG